MMLLRNKILLIFVFLLLSQTIFAQNHRLEQIIVPLSNPGSPGRLIINHYKGSIHVNGYDGNVVIIEASYRQIESSDGMKIISNSSLQLNATERNNRIIANTNSHQRTVDLKIKVPKSLSLNLTTYHNGEINVNNVKGELEINNNNGNILLTKISGSAVLSTIDGDITVEFEKVEQNVPMAITSVEGDLDITLPPGVNSFVKMKSDYGEIFTDFEIKFAKRKTQIDKSDKTGLVKIFLDDWIHGTINRGGPELLLKTLNGNIYIRKGI